MKTITFSPINTQGDLDKVLMQLRLRQLSLTLEIINAIRDVIEKPKLDEEFHKVVEREFSAQWKDIQKKNHLEEWSKNQWGKKLSPMPSLRQVESPKKKAEVYDEPKRKKKQHHTTNQSSKTQKKDFPKMKSKAKEWSRWSFPIPLNIPSAIETISQIEELLYTLKKYPKKITYNLTHDIASRIRVEKVFDYYKEELRDIRQKIEFDMEKKRNNWRKPLVGSGTITDRVPIIIEKASDTNNLYDNFEYGLSDWDR